MFIRNSIRLLKMDTGYESKQVVYLKLQFPTESSYQDARKVGVLHQIVARLGALPEVEEVTISNPPYGGSRLASVSLNGERPSIQDSGPKIAYSYVQANYFKTLKIPMISGVSFPSTADDGSSLVILSATAAKKLWDTENPIGRNIRLGTALHTRDHDQLSPDGRTYQVVGVAGDTLGASIDGSDAAQIYLLAPTNQPQEYSVLIRTKVDSTELIRVMGPVISSIDPNVVAYASTLEDMLHLTPRFTVSSVSSAIAVTVGILGLLLASMGIYGTVSYIVVQRTREVGIRMALGAQKIDVLLLMLRECSRPVLAGLFVGMGLALGVCYLLRGVLSGLSGADSLIFVAVSLLFLAIALFAAYVPSRRAMRVDPVVALRYE
jgi:hypothetical protein